MRLESAANMGRLALPSSAEEPTWTDRASHSVIRGLARASCALVACDGDGRPTKTLQLPVPRHLPQTSQAAEHFIAAVAYECLRGSAELIGDCLGVVKAFTSDIRRALAPTRKTRGW